MDSIELVRRADGTVDIDATVDFYDDRWANNSAIYRFQARHRQAAREQLRTMLANADLPPRP